MTIKHFFTACLVLVFRYSLCGAEIQVRLFQRINEETQPPRLELMFRFYQEGHPLQDCLRKTPQLTDPRNYEVVVLKDGKPVPFVIEKVLAPETAGWSSKVVLQQKLGTVLDSSLVYHAKPRDLSIWHFRDATGAVTDQFIYATPDGGTPALTGYAPTDTARQKLNEKWLSQTYAYEKKIALESGEKGAAATVSWRFYLHDDPFANQSLDRWRFEWLGKASIGLPSRDRKDWLDQIHSEANVFWSRTWGGSADSWRLYVDYGAGGTIDADQNFEGVTGGGGARLRFTLGNPLTDYLSNALPNHANALLGPHRALVVSPMFNIGYSYTDNLKENDSTSDSHQRLDASLFWRWPLARHMTWQKSLGIPADYDVDLRIELAGAWELDRGVFHDATKLTLELTPSEGTLGDPSKLPVVTITYANGEVSPHFEHVDTWLAGFKYVF